MPKKIPSRKERKKLKKKYANFEQFNQDMQKVTGAIAQIFEEIAQKSGIKFVNTAKTQTKTASLVDTGYYIRNWTADLLARDDTYEVKGYNPVEYASHLEYGHKIKNTGKRFEGRFIGTFSIRQAEEYAIKELKKRLGDLFK